MSTRNTVQVFNTSFLGEPSEKVKKAMIDRFPKKVSYMKIKATNGNMVYIPTSELSNPINYVLDGAVQYPFSKYSDISADDSISEVYLEDELGDGRELSIGQNYVDGGFPHCSNLVSAYFKHAVNLGIYSFTNTSLKKIDFPSLKVTEYGTFWGVKTLEDTDVHLPNVLSIGNSSLRSTNIKSIDAPKLKYLGGEQSMGDSMITSVNFPELESTAGESFLGFQCEELNLPKLKNVGVGADSGILAATFYNCNKLTSISLPKLQNIQRYCFWGCEKLSVIELPSVTDISDDNGYTSNSFIFANCTSLLSVSIPNLSAGTFGSNCFYNCSSLKYMNLSAVPNVVSLDNAENTFANTPNGISVLVPENLLDSFTTAEHWKELYEAGKFIFMGTRGGVRNPATLIVTTTSGKVIEIPKNMVPEHLGYMYHNGSEVSVCEPFSKYSELSSADTIASIRDDYGLVLSVGNKVIDGKTYGFEYGSDSITSLWFPSATYLDATQYTSVSSIDFPCVTTLGDNWYYAHNSKITCLNLPSLKQMLGPVVGCNNLGIVRMDRVEYMYVGTDGFGAIGDGMLTEMHVSNLVSCDTPYMCNSQKHLSSINLPRLKNIYDGFLAYSGIVSIDLPSAVILGNAKDGRGYNIFGGCTSLTSISMPNISSGYFGTNCFSYCSNLKTINLSAVPTVPAMDNSTNIFTGTPDGISVIVPEDLVETFKTKANWSTYYASGKLNFIGVPRT